MMQILKCIIHDSILQTKKYVEENLFGFAEAINIFLPYAMFFIGQCVANCTIDFWGCELLIPVFVFFVIHCMRQYANKIGKGITIPIPTNRFTECQEDGEVTVHYSRLQEMILYMADLEDWLKRNGLGENTR